VIFISHVMELALYFAECAAAMTPVLTGCVREGDVDAVARNADVVREIFRQGGGCGLVLGTRDGADAAKVKENAVPRGAAEEDVSPSLRTTWT
jgi:hypothetical protein